MCGYIEFKVVLNFFGCTVNKIWSDDLVTWMDHHHCNKLKAKYIIAFLTKKTLAQTTYFPILVTIFTNAKKQLTHTDTHVRACARVCVCVLRHLFREEIDPFKSKFWIFAANSTVLP